jgi:hypothetical protein
MWSSSCTESIPDTSLHAAASAVTHGLSVFREVTAGADRSGGLIPDLGAAQVPQRQPKVSMTGWVAKPSGDSVSWCCDWQRTIQLDRVWIDLQGVARVGLG